MCVHDAQTQRQVAQLGVDVDEQAEAEDLEYVWMLCIAVAMPKWHHDPLEHLEAVAELDVVQVSRVCEGLHLPHAVELAQVA